MFVVFVETVIYLTSFLKKTYSKNSFNCRYTRTAVFELPKQRSVDAAKQFSTLHKEIEEHKQFGLRLTINLQNNNVETYSLFKLKVVSRATMSTHRTTIPEHNTTKLKHADEVTGARTCESGQEVSHHNMSVCTLRNVLKAGHRPVEHTSNT